MKVKAKTAQKLWPAFLLAVLLFLCTMYYTAYETPFFIGGGLCLIAVWLIGHFAGWKPSAQITGLTVTFFAFIVLCGAASLYTTFQEFGLPAFAKWLTTFTVFLAVAVACKRQYTRTVMQGVALCIGIMGFFSIDSSSLKVFTDFFVRTLMRLDTAGYGYWGDGRISGLFTNPNVSGCIFALGIFLALYLALTAKGRGEQIAMYSALLISSMAFLLSFSMGSIVFFAVAVVIYLAAATKANRPYALVLMVETALCTMLFAVVATVGLGKSGAITAVPDLCMVAGSLTLWLLDIKVGARLGAKLAQNGRAVALILGGTAAAAALYLVAGLNVTGGMNFKPGEQISRSAYPAGGAYTLAVEGNASDLTVEITAQDSRQTAMHTSTLLYEGKADGASFTVPEGTKVAYFALRTAGGGKVSSVTYSGASSGALKLKYLLLPGFAATRVQGLWANQNVIQRVTFFEDSVKIWQMSPVFGKGMAAFEGYRPQVADFYYVTKYAHNVYLQTMAETGLVGLVLLVATLGGFAYLLLKGRKDEESAPLVAPLLACLAMMCGHGTFEVIWSSTACLMLFSFIFALIQVNFGRGLALPALEKKVVGRSLLAVGTLFFAVTAFFQLQPSLDKAMVDRAQGSGDYAMFMDALETAAGHSVYASDFYKVAYLRNVGYGATEDLFPADEAFARADGYAASLLHRNAYDYAYAAAVYYFERGATEDAFSALLASTARGRTDTKAWDDAVGLVMAHFKPDDGATLSGTQQLLRAWQTADARQLDGLPLTPMHETFLKTAAAS